MKSSSNGQEEVSAKMSRFTSSRSTNLLSISTKTFSLRRKGIYYIRRDKRNSFIDELASLLPTCKSKSRKLNKLSVLRSAVNYYTEVNPKPVFFSDEELKHMIQRAADGFLFVVDCHQGKILFVSESVFKILNYSHNDLIGQSLFDYLHPKDISVVKEQLSTAVTRTQERIIDPKLCKTVFCRMVKAFCTIRMDLYEIDNLDNDGCNFSCLVAVGRLHPRAVSQQVPNHIKRKPIEFVSRHAIDGMFGFVDHRTAAILAYLPQELLGTSFYEYFHEDDIAHLSECHRKVLQTREKINTNCYKFKMKDGSFITVRSGFKNPWTKEVECIVSTGTVVTLQPLLVTDEGRTGVLTEAGTRTGAGRTGQMIAEELLDIQRYIYLSANVDIRFCLSS
uniref:Basic helix-loop-helix ARNT like 1 n=1 Tax=Sparus aurata TaxID=8175 RepID=A0A671XJA4_SPAAU